jgi:uncharacterized protein
MLTLFSCHLALRHVHTDCDIKRLPRRRTDGSYIVDTEAHTIKLYTTPGATKLIKRFSLAVAQVRKVFLNMCSIATQYAAVVTRM